MRAGLLIEELARPVERAVPELLQRPIPIGDFLTVRFSRSVFSRMSASRRKIVFLHKSKFELKIRLAALVQRRFAIFITEERFFTESIRKHKPECLQHRKIHFRCWHCETNLSGFDPKKEGGGMWGGRGSSVQKSPLDRRTA